MHRIIHTICADLLHRYGDGPLFVRPGTDEPPLSRRNGYFPLLVDYSHEDKAAKGLRKLVDPAADRTPIYFSALELAAQEDALFLSGSSGSGKSCFVLDLALSLAGEVVGDPDFNLARLRRRPPRNERGLRQVEDWTGSGAIPIYLPVDSHGRLADLLDQTVPEARQLLSQADRPPVLVIVDGVERAAAGPDLLADLVALLDRHAGVRVLATGESPLCDDWVIPGRLHRHALLPLLVAQRAAYRVEVFAGKGAPASTLPAHPALFSLAIGIDAPPPVSHQLVDAWLARAYTAAERDRLAIRLFDHLCRGDTGLPESLPRGCQAVGLVSSHLETRSVETVAALFEAAPDRWSAALTMMLDRRRDHGADQTPLLRTLIAASSPAARDRGALIAAGHLAAGGDPGLWPHLIPRLIDALASPSLPAHRRDAAARHLARHGDPRNLEELVDLPAGRFTMGSLAHPNSQPVHTVTVPAFRMGRFPVTNRLYGQFVAARGLPWTSLDGLDPERSNAPAVDLSWHDARACCAWLTGEWRKEGRIGRHEIIRLPTEAEWEYAARDGQMDGGTAIIYPWAGLWQPDHANSSEAGFNTTTGVGIFPAGRTGSGIADLSGQVWEWTSTLWGDDMAVPHWRYPYADDGREDGRAGPRMRRVLRGGCFSSGKEKANCTYRGSLEPAGFWRGNGFRVVAVAAD